MSKLLFDTLKFLGKLGKDAATYGHAKRHDLRNETGILHTILTGEISSNKGSRFQSASEQLKLFASSNRGLLIDGKNKRLSLDDSCKHVLILAPTGGGKTTKYIIPNLFQLAESNNSIIVTDPSGEIFANTSRFMQKQGFEVLKFDPTDPDHSIYFNPLKFVFSYHTGSTEVDQVKASLLASTLVATTMTNDKDAFWRASAEELIEFAISCLKEAPRDCHNLYNVYKFIENMTPGGQLLEKYISAFVHDTNLERKWTSLVMSDSKTFNNQLSTAKTSLKSLANNHIARMTAKNSIDFTNFKKKKTVLYLTFPPNEADFYRFLLNVFYTQLFHDYMSAIPDKKDLPLFILYDEFGHSSIPNFDIISTNIRKYKVSMSLVLQSVSQLETRYGKDKARTIIEGGIGSRLFYSGTSLDTAEEIEKLLGKVIRDTYTSKTDKGSMNRQEFNLLNADEIRTLGDNQAIFITGNKKPVLLEIKPFYEHGASLRKSKLGMAHIPANNFYSKNLPTIFDYL